jgi:hypothetical protein
MPRMVLNIFILLVRLFASLERNCNDNPIPYSRRSQNTLISGRQIRFEGEESSHKVRPNYTLNRIT